MAAPGYSRARILLHWLSAAVISWATITGFAASLCPRQTLFRMAIDLVNPQLTTLFIPFFLWRTGLYLRARPWSRWAGAGPRERVAMLVHGLLYGAVLVVLASGVLMMPRPWALLGLLPMPVLGAGQAGLFLLHRGACMALAGLIALHLGAVVMHLGLGHPVLRRMSVGRV
ncbi:cytochrome b [Acidocella sp.]|uniref:cytochrome b n=1 Tax=Acidocella sp. TaxID=50710 RepID=UPI003D01A065